MEYREMETDSQVLERLMALSEDWEKENSCRGYRRNGIEDIRGNRVFAALEGEEIMGYLFGHEKEDQKATSAIPQGARVFWVEELYVCPAYRCRGVGRKLFTLAQEKLKEEGMEYLDLSTATKDYKAILHFYIEELGMEFWSAQLFKKLTGD